MLLLAINILVPPTDFFLSFFCFVPSLFLFRRWLLLHFILFQRWRHRQYATFNRSQCSHGTEKHRTADWRKKNVHVNAKRNWKDRTTKSTTICICQCNRLFDSIGFINFYLDRFRNGKQTSAEKQRNDVCIVSFFSIPTKLALVREKKNKLNVMICICMRMRMSMCPFLIDCSCARWIRCSLFFCEKAIQYNYYLLYYSIEPEDEWKKENRWTGKLYNLYRLPVSECIDGMLHSFPTKPINNNRFECVWGHSSCNSYLFRTLQYPKREFNVENIIIFANK